MRPQRCLALLFPGGFAHAGLRMRPETPGGVRRGCSPPAPRPPVPLTYRSPGVPTGQLGEARVYTLGFQTWQDLLLIMFPSDVTLQRCVFRSLQQPNRRLKSPSGSEAPASPCDALAETSAGRLRSVRPTDAPFLQTPARPPHPGTPTRCFGGDGAAQPGCCSPAPSSEQRHRGFTPRGPQPRDRCPRDRLLLGRAVSTCT